MNIAIAGTGYVGLVSGVCLAEKGHHVTCVDIDEAKLELMRQGHSPIYENDLEELMRNNNAAGRLHYTSDYRSAYAHADAIFIGVGTPEMADGSANLSYLSDVCRQIAESVEQDCLVVIKSTVPVGTNDKVERFLHDFQKHPVKIEVASNPEFLAQGTAVHDTLKAARIVIGTESAEAEAVLREIYEPFGLPIVSVSRRSAEMIKYASNGFLALKISYINDIANLCELVGASIDDVVEGMKYDSRIGEKFLHAGIGYGGSCFPKDTSALFSLANSLHYELKTVDAAIQINRKQKLRLFQKARERLLTLQGLKDYRAEVCCAGHIHGPACSMAFTALRPKSVSPVLPGAVTPLPISVAPFQVRVHMRTPSRWRSWICSSVPPSAAPLSTVRMAPWRPSRSSRSRSPGALS